MFIAKSEKSALSQLKHVTLGVDDCYCCYRSTNDTACITRQRVCRRGKTGLTPTPRKSHRFQTATAPRWARFTNCCLFAAGVQTARFPWPRCTLPKLWENG